MVLKILRALNVFEILKVIIVFKKSETNNVSKNFQR